MNEIANEVLKRADVIGMWLSGTIATGVDFATQQAIDIAMQYVLFGRVYHTILFLFLSTSIIFLSRISWNNRDYINRETGGVLWIPICAVSMFLFGVVVRNFKDVILTWFAPKIWLIIQLSELVKTAK